MRNKFSKIALAATLGFAIAFTISCSSGSDDPPNGGGGSGGVVHGVSVNYQGEPYQTVVIGTQTWMARNLNYNVSGSVCYDNDPANCDKYGRLYDWATAMALPSTCNSTECSLQMSAKHRGICPSGWHIPSDAEWTTLSNYVGSSVDARKLRATSGWSNCGPSGSGNSYLCEDTYGFAALPGGRCSLSDKVDCGEVDRGFWWSSSDAGSSAYLRRIYYNLEGIHRDVSADKGYLLSVRCVRD